MTFHCRADYLLSRFGIPAFLCFSLPLLAWIGNLSEPRALKLFLFLALIVVVVILSSILLYIRLFPVRITQTGIVGHNSNGTRKSLKWEEVVCEGRISNYGFPCYRLASKKRNAYILLPVFLKNYEKLEAILNSHGLELNASSPPQSTAPKRRHIAQRREAGYIIITTEKPFRKQL